MGIPYAGKNACLWSLRVCLGDGVVFVGAYSIPNPYSKPNCVGGFTVSFFSAHFGVVFCAYINTCTCSSHTDLKVPVALSAKKDRNPKRTDMSSKDILAALSFVQLI